MSQTSLDDLVRRIRLEAEALGREFMSEATPRVLASSAAELCPLPRDDWNGMLHHQALNVVDLLAFDGDEFIDVVYLALFGRAADPGGRDNLRRARNAGTSRLELLVRLLLSEEAKERKVRINGWSYWFNLLYLVRPSRLVRSVFRYLESRLLNRTSVLALPVARYANWISFPLNEVLQDISSRRLADGAKHQQALVERIDEIQNLVNQNRRDLLYFELRERAPKTSPASVAKPSRAVDGGLLDAYYVAFEDANRGSSEVVRQKQMVYVELLQRETETLRHRPVLDIGCGRGEWIELLRENGFLAQGADVNPVMVNICCNKGLEVEHADVLAALTKVPDNSLAAVTSFHVIEHLPFEVLFSSVSEAWRVLAPGGVIILETPNPENILVGSHTFYHDFTHRNPITPTAISFLAKYLNFFDVRIERLNPYL